MLLAAIRRYQSLMPWASPEQLATGAGGWTGGLCRGAGPANMWPAAPAPHPGPTSALHAVPVPRYPVLGSCGQACDPWPPARARAGCGTRRPWFGGPREDMVPVQVNWRGHCQTAAGPPTPWGGAWRWCGALSVPGMAISWALVSMPLGGTATSESCPAAVAFRSGGICPQRGTSEWGWSWA